MTRTARTAHGTPEGSSDFKIIAVVRSDGRTEEHGPYPTRDQAERKAAALRREAQRNAPFLSPETNAAFNVKILETES